MEGPCFNVSVFVKSSLRLIITKTKHVQCIALSVTQSPQGYFQALFYYRYTVVNTQSSIEF